MKFIIKGVEYDAADVRRVSLREIIAFDRESVREGYGILWAQVEDRLNAFMGKTDEEKRQDPDFFLLFGLTIWATRVLAGERVSFAEAIDIDISPDSTEFRVIKDEPQDAPPTPPRARPTPKGGGRATAKQAKKKASTSARSASVRTSKAKLSSGSSSSRTSGQA